jgi:hypothetical protein
MPSFGVTGGAAVFACAVLGAGEQPIDAITLQRTARLHRIVVLLLVTNRLSRSAAS